jgi:hypothetical protein
MIAGSLVAMRYGDAMSQVSDAAWRTAIRFAAQASTSHLNSRLLTGCARRQINRLIAGGTPAWAAEGSTSPEVILPVRYDTPSPHMSLLLPVDFFRDVTAR